eukprot:g8756.t2
MAPHASFPSTTARDPRTATAVDLFTGGACGEDITAAAALPDVASSTLQQGARFLSLDLGAAADPADGGALVASWSSSAVSPLLVISSAAPGNPATASGLFGIAALVIALGAGPQTGGLGPRARNQSVSRPIWFDYRTDSHRVEVIARGARYEGGPNFLFRLPHRALVFSTVTGKNGLGAFLSQEKGSNPFYQDTMAKYVPKTPDILNKIRLPDLDFVDVYNQPPLPDDYVDLEEDTTPDPMNTGAPDPNAIATAESMRQKLLMAVQAKDYELASSLERELANFMRKNGMGYEGDQ